MCTLSAIDIVHVGVGHIRGAPYGQHGAIIQAEHDRIIKRILNGSDCSVWDICLLQAMLQHSPSSIKTTQCKHHRMPLSCLLPLYLVTWLSRDSRATVAWQSRETKQNWNNMFAHHRRQSSTVPFVGVIVGFVSVNIFSLFSFILFLF